MWLLRTLRVAPHVPDSEQGWSQEQASAIRGFNLRLCVPRGGVKSLLLASPVVRVEGAASSWCRGVSSVSSCWAAGARSGDARGVSGNQWAASRVGGE